MTKGPAARGATSVAIAAGSRKERLIMRVMIRYRLKPDRVEQNLELLRAYFEELRSVQPDGLRDVVFQLEDKVSIVQFVETGEDGPGPLPQLKAFQRYRTTLDDRCDEPPILTVLHELGSYRSH
jgi:hypothetical protein